MVIVFPIRFFSLLIPILSYRVDFLFLITEHMEHLFEIMNRYMLVPCLTLFVLEGIPRTP